MKSFLASMCVVTGIVVGVATVNSGMTGDGKGSNSASVAEQSKKMISQVKSKIDVGDLKNRFIVTKKVYKINSKQLHKKLSPGVEVEAERIDGKKITISRDDIGDLEQGTYIFHLNNKIYKYRAL